MLKAATLDLAGDRWTAFDTTLEFEELDLTGATFEAHIRMTYDTPGTPLVDLDTVGTPNTQGLRFIEYADDGTGTMVSYVAMRVNETTMEGLPAATEVGEDAVFYWDLLITPSGGLKQRYLKGKFTVEGGATQ